MNTYFFMDSTSSKPGFSLSENVVVENIDRFIKTKVDLLLRLSHHK
jgi:hypothetical protein